MYEISSKISFPNWLSKIIPIEFNKEDEYILQGSPFILQDDILRSKSILSNAQKQTEQTFNFKWKKRETFESLSNLKRMREWLISRYGDPAQFSWLKEYTTPPILLDAGCGGGLSGIEYWKHCLKNIHYLGVDVSGAVDVAKQRFSEINLPGYFLQCDLMSLPLAKNSIDIIFSEGVLHHTDSTEKSLKKLAQLLKVGGRFLFYIYRKKGPIREFTDDYLRHKLQDMSEEQAWEAMIPLSKLGQILGELNIEIDIPEAIQLLDIPAGKINLQRLIYWHVFKAFYHPELTLDEINHINFDWYAPSNASRHTVAEVNCWCQEANLEIEKIVEEPAGITVIARKCSSS